MVRFGLLGKIAAIKVDEIDIGDAVRGRQAEGVVPDGLGETTGDQPAVWQSDLRPTIDDRRDNRAAREDYPQQVLVTRVKIH